MRRRRHGLVRFEAQDWVRQSAHPRKLRKNHMVQAWVLGLSWMTGPVEQVLLGRRQPACMICLQPESLILAQNERWRHA